MDSLSPELLNTLINDYLVPWSIRIVTAILVYYIGRIIARWIVRLTRHMLERAGIDPMLNKFLCNVLNGLLIAVVAIAALDQLGVDTTSLLAVLGAAGLAVGLALKDSLGNFAAGVMLVIFRPFRIGDFVEAGGVAGVVEDIGIFSTTFRTGDNRIIIVPNGQIYGGTILNASARDTRRIDLVIGIGYDDDIKKAKRILEDILETDDRILEDPAPAISLGELADSSVNLNVRPWVKSSDYWPVRSDLLERIKNAFDAEGISIPYPQRDVHLYQEKAA